MIILKNIFFKTHYIGMLITPYLWILFPNIIWIYPIIILSWKINDNKCILSQLEEKLFGEIFLGPGKKNFVPLKHRIILYVNFLIGFVFYYKDYSIFLSFCPFMFSSSIFFS